MKERRPGKRTRLRQSRARNAGPSPGVKRDPAEIVGMRLNKYIAHSGICSRRQAAEYVKDGLVKVNGQLEQNPAYQIQDGDVVTFRGKVVQPEADFVYVLGQEVVQSTGWVRWYECAPRRCNIRM